ncbi:MAG: VOC family protein [Rhodothermaceae bacterium]|nr:VOC family protein [Rhodothermaceae bacterium]
MNGSFRTVPGCVALILLASTATSAQQPEPWVPEIGTRQFFAVLVEDVEQSADWYRRAFGLTEHDRWTADDSTARIINLMNEHLFVELIWRTDAPDVDRSLGIFKVGFWVPDVDAIADRVEAATGERPPALDVPAHTLRLIQLRDPDGNIIQLSEALGD